MIETKESKNATNLNSRVNVDHISVAIQYIKSVHESISGKC